MRNLLSNVLRIVTIISIIIGILAILGWVRSSGEKQRAIDNLYNKTVQWEDERGRMVTETTELRFTNRELRKVGKKDSTNLSDVEKKLLDARILISDLKIKPRKVESTHMLELESASEQVTKLTIEDLGFALEPLYKVSIAPIKTKHLELIFNQVGDSLHVSHLYRTDIDVVVDRDKGLNDKGKKRFFVVRWIRPRWEYSSNVVAEDPDAEITSNVYINFQRRKGRRK